MRAKPRKARPPRGAGPSWAPRVEWGLALLLTLLAVVCHGSFFAHAGPLWRDEVNTAEFAAMPSLHAIQENLQYDSFPIGSTLALRAWTSIAGRSDPALRTYGLVVGILFLASLWLAARLLNRSLPVLALALVGLNPWVILGADSVRPYGLGMVFIALTVGALGRAVASSSARWFVLAGASAILSVQCLYQNAFLLAAICIAAALAAVRGVRVKRLVGIGAVVLAAALSLLPYLPSIAKAREWGLILPIRPSWAELIRHVPDTTGGAGAVQNWLWLAALALGLGLGIQSLVTRRKDTPPAPSLAVYGSALILTATVIFMAAVKAAQVATQPWYYAPLLAAIAPALDATIHAAAPRGARIATLAIALLAAAAAMPAVQRQLEEPRTNIDRVAGYLEAHANSGDAIVVYPFYIGVSFQRYYRGAVAWTPIPPVREIRIHRYDLFKELMTRSDTMDPVLATMGRALQAGHQVWIVGGLQTPRMDQPPPSLPPAPHPATGWLWGPYNRVWGEQAAYFLSSHGTRFNSGPDLGVNQTSPYERVSLLVVSGWK